MREGREEVKGTSLTHVIYRVFADIQDTQKNCTKKIFTTQIITMV